MRWFLAVLRSLFHSSLSYTFSCHSSPPTIFPSSLTSSSHLFLGLPLGLVSKFIYNTLLGNLLSSILCTCPNHRNLCSLNTYYIFYKSLCYIWRYASKSCENLPGDLSHSSQLQLCVSQPLDLSHTLLEVTLTTYKSPVHFILVIVGDTPCIVQLLFLWETIRLIWRRNMHH